MTLTSPYRIVVEQLTWPNAVLPSQHHQTVVVRTVDAVSAFALDTRLQVDTTVVD
jgi:hypothetical protein